MAKAAKEVRRCFEDSASSLVNADFSVSAQSLCGCMAWKLPAALPLQEPETAAVTLFWLPKLPLRSTLQSGMYTLQNPSQKIAIL